MSDAPVTPPVVAAAPVEAPAAAPTPTPIPSTEVSGPGPAIGATPPEAGGDAAPAVSSTPEPAAAPAEPSILSAAAPEVKAEEPAAEPAAEAPKEPAAPLAAPTYEPFTLPEGVTLDAEKVTGFTGLLGEFENKIAADPAQAHTAFQELGQKLVELHTAEVRDAANRYTQLQTAAWDQTRETWRSEFRNDPDLGRNRQQTTLTRMGALMDLYGQSAGPDRLNALRDVMTNTGAGDNLETLRFVNWMAQRLTETSRVVVPMMPRAPQPAGTKAERLYKNSSSLNGAA